MRRRRFLLVSTIWLSVAHHAVSNAHAKGLTWINPKANTVVGSGDMITGNWTTSNALVSPSVSLCTSLTKASSGGGDDCGKPMWPTIKEDGVHFSFSIVAPELSQKSSFYLKLKDDLGTVIKSPKFAVDPSIQKNASVAGSTISASDIGDEDLSATSVAPTRAQSPPQAPITSSAVPSIDTMGMSGSRPSIVAIPVSSMPLNPGSGGFVPPGTDQVGFITTVTVDTQTTGPSPTLAPAQLATNNHAQISAAAVAVPLALVGATLLASILMCIVHRRQMATQRSKNVDLLDSSAPVNATKRANLKDMLPPTDPTGVSDVEKAIERLYSYERCGRSLSRDHLPPQPIPRQDVRRDRLYMPYVSRNPTPWTYVEERGVSPSEEYAYATRSNEKGRRYVVENGSDFDCGESATGAVLSEYLTPSIPYRSGSYASYDSHDLRIPPRTRSGHTAPDRYGHEGRREGYRGRDLYDAVSRAVSRSTASNRSYYEGRSPYSYRY